MIADGLREQVDYRICEKRFAVKILLTFYDSPLADSQTQVSVVNISVVSNGGGLQCFDAVGWVAGRASGL